MYVKNTKSLKDLLDTYSDLNLMNICHIVFKTLNYGVGISFIYFLRENWGVWSFEKEQIFKFSMILLWFNCLYKYKHYNTFYGKPKKKMSLLSTCYELWSKTIFLFHYIVRLFAFYYFNISTSKTRFFKLCLKFKLKNL